MVSPILNNFWEHSVSNFHIHKLRVRVSPPDQYFIDPYHIEIITTTALNFQDGGQWVVTDSIWYEDFANGFCRLCGMGSLFHQWIHHIS